MTTVCVVIPCFNEAGNIEPLLAELSRQIPADAPWLVVVVDDSSTDNTAKLVRAAAKSDGRIVLLSGTFGSPGTARTAGANSVVHSHLAPEWLVTIDADVELAPDWYQRWNDSLCAYDDPAIGAVNGVEMQDHLFAKFPHAQVVSNAFGSVIGASESALGVTNLNGVNHAVRTSAFLTAGPYVQPTMQTTDGVVSLAGEDWDLGVRIRLAGFVIRDTDAAVKDRGRRLLADVRAYVSGDAYEGAFLRLESKGSSTDVHSDDLERLVQGAVERSLRHFFFKPILAGCVPTSELSSLSIDTRAALAGWMLRWPAPSFADSRNGFMFGRLPRFSAEHWQLVASELQLNQLLASSSSSSSSSSSDL